MDVLTGIVQLVWASYFTDRIIRRFGAVTGMIALPVVMTVCIVSYLIGVSFSNTGAALIWITSITRVCDITLRKSLEKPSFAAYCLGFGDRRRQRLLRNYELVVKPVSSIIAAALMTVVTESSGQHLEMSAWLCLTLLVAWIFVAAIFAWQPVERSVAIHDTRISVAQS